VDAAASLTIRCEESDLKERYQVAMAVVGIAAMAVLFLFVVNRLIGRHRLPHSGEYRLALQQAVEGFVGEVSAAQYGAAFERMSDAYQAGVSLQEFQEALSSNPYLRRAHIAGIRNYEQMGDTAALTGVLESQAGSVAAVFNFSRQDDRWAIVGVTLGGVPALPGYAAG